MPLYTILREYEERRSALIEQLKNNPNMDPAVQHQIYGAIKEIENFLKTVEFQVAASREQSISIELARDRPRPLVERTKKIAGKMKAGAARVGGTMKRGAQRVATVPKRYVAKRRERKALKQQIERELLARLQHNAAATGDLPQHVHQDLRQPLPPPMPAEQDPMESELARVVDESVKAPSPEREPKKRRTAKKTVKRSAKKSPKKAPAKKPSGKKTAKKRRR